MDRCRSGQAFQDITKVTEMLSDVTSKETGTLTVIRQLTDLEKCATKA